MRIISGSLGGRKIYPPTKMPHTRPTTDRAKEGLFNIIQNNFQLQGATTLDLFGGTGCISYELASRGAAHVTIIEKDNNMCQFIKKNIDNLGIANSKLLQQDVFKYIDQCVQQFNFIFAGPPYALTTINDLPLLIQEKKLLAPNGWFVLEHTPDNNYEKLKTFSMTRNYGTTVFSFFLERKE
jgi:16S rRNA (guanine966-N2)-methyltransferase